MKVTVKVNKITLEVDEKWFETIAKATSPDFMMGGEVCNWLPTSTYEKVVYVCDNCGWNISADMDNVSVHPDFCITCYSCIECGEYEEKLFMTDTNNLICGECNE